MLIYVFHVNDSWIILNIVSDVSNEIITQNLKL
jgi:hypothetical protein